MPVERFEVEITASGYIYLNAQLSAAHFPNHAVLATIESGNLILWPTSGASAGGLILKQRNAAGDRCVFLAGVLPAHIVPGKRDAVWDTQLARLSISLQNEFPEAALGVNTFIEEENGRWAVYLEVGFWRQNAEGDPVSVTRRRINDYPTRRDAEVAASWMQRSSERNISRPPEGN